MQMDKQTNQTDRQTGRQIGRIAGPNRHTDTQPVR